MRSNFKQAGDKPTAKQYYKTGKVLGKGAVIAGSKSGSRGRSFVTKQGLRAGKFFGNGSNRGATAQAIKSGARYAGPVGIVSTSVGTLVGGTQQLAKNLVRKFKKKNKKKSKR